MDNHIHKSLFFSGPKPRVIGHRGAAGAAPGNTLAAFERAVADGADIVELDVHRTHDGEVVIIHDDTVDRTTDGRGAVKRLPLAEIQRFDAGYAFVDDDGRHAFRGRGVVVPTLQQLFTRLPEIKAIVEIKQSNPPIVKDVLDIVRRAGKENDVLLATEHDAVMRDIRAELGADSTCATGFCRGEVAAFVAALMRGAAAGYRPAGAALQVPPEAEGVQLVTAQTLAAAHALGLEIFVWTINDDAEMERLLALGADGI
ncbi:MAG TPA: glycerophosphodiester phosphodiesterase, partial [Candidatus Binatia bacterium]|nr:glycerophosphodiester phosphodiesterase [Candidatus Binatia bacterium]